MAPEQFLGADVDARADQWGLAVTLHEALAGRRPFAGPDLAATRAAVLHGSYEPPEAPAAVRAVLQRALQRDPAARFADTLAFVDALRPTRRRWRAPLLLSGLVVMVAGALWWQRPAAYDASDPRPRCRSASCTRSGPRPTRSAGPGAPRARPMRCGTTSSWSGPASTTC
ncbi:MAG: hypothetical protein U0168_09650 [Nannocystaceae bacterium]